MPTKTQGYLTGEFLLSEGEATLSRDQATVTIAGGVGLPSGTVMGQITATSKWIKSLTGAADGSQNAKAVLLTDLSAAANGDTKAVLITRAAEVIGAVLNGGAGPLSGQATSLGAAQIIVR